MKRYVSAIALSVLLTPAASFAASKEQLEMQRDIASLQDQVQRLQSSFDQQMTAIRTLVEQALDAGNKANTSVSVLSREVTQTLDRELKDSMRPVAGLTAKIDNANNDLSDVKASINELTAQLNRIQQQIGDVNNQLKVIQAPPAAPPPGVGGDASAGGLTRGGVPPSAQQVYSNARADYSSRPDVAAQEFADFVRMYPDDPNAPEAQFTIGEIHLSQGKYDQAVMDFDAVLERFPENAKTPDAYFMKGKALKSNGQRDEAAKTWRKLIAKYPRSDSADAAGEQLRAMGLKPSPAAARKK